MKKFLIINFIFFVSYSYSKDINLIFNMTGFIKAEYFDYLNSSIKFWIERNTSYKVNEKSQLVLNVNLKRSSNLFILEATLREQDIISQSYSSFASLSSFFNALDDVLYKIFHNQTLDSQSLLIQTTDVVFLLDSTSSMKEEIDFLKNNAEDIVFSLIYNLKNYRLRLGIADFREFTDYKIKFTNLSYRIEDFLKHVLSIKEIGYNSDLYNAIDHVIKYANWKNNRFIIAVIDSVPVLIDKLKELKKKLECANIQIIFLLADGIKSIEKKTLVSVFPNSVVDLDYILTFVDDKMSIRNFIYRDKSLYEIKEDYVIDISLGREVSSIRAVKDFLNSNSIPVKELKKISIGFKKEIDKIFVPSNTNFLVFSDDENEVLVPIRDKKSYEKKGLKKDKNYFIGGCFIKYNENFLILPYTFRILSEKVMSPIYQDFKKIARDPVFFYDKGIFEPSFWVTSLKYKGIR